MHLPSHPDLLDRIAADYALGTLRGGARRRFEAMARSSAAVRTAAVMWHERLIAFTELQQAEAPSPNVWKRIQNAIESERVAAAPATAARAQVATGARWWKLGVLAGAVATVAAIAVGLQLGRNLQVQGGELAHLRQQGTQLAQRNAQLMAQLAAQPDIRYVAVLADDKASASMLALFDPKHNTLTLKRVGGYLEAADKSLQLWALTEAGPRSMGVLPGDAVMKLGAVEQQLQQSPALAVSLEPKGGVPGEGGPTGPVLFKGAVLQAPI